MTPGQIWLNQLQVGSMESRGFGLVEGEVAGIMNPFVHVDLNAALRVAARVDGSDAYVKWYDPLDAAIKETKTELSAIEFERAVESATGIIFQSHGSWMPGRFSLSDVSYKWLVLT